MRERCLYRSRPGAYEFPSSKALSLLSDIEKALIAECERVRAHAGMDPVGLLNFLRDKKKGSRLQHYRKAIQSGAYSDIEKNLEGKGMGIWSEAAISEDKVLVPENKELRVYAVIKASNGAGRADFLGISGLLNNPAVVEKVIEKYVR